MSQSLESLQLKHTNGKYEILLGRNCLSILQLAAHADATLSTVSQPRLLRTRSEQSLTASEDYYSLSSGSSGRSNRRASRQRSQSESRKPRRPAASRYQTARESYEGIARPVEVVRQVETPRLTPMRGIGKRRREEPEAESFDFRRSSPIRRKPVPSTVFENPPDLVMGRPLSSHPPPRMAQSSAARQLSPPSPGLDDDTPFIHFALDQLNRDEEVRGSRSYVESRRPRDEYDLGPLPFEEEMPTEPQYQKYEQRNFMEEEPLSEKPMAFAPIPPRNPARRSVTHMSSPSRKPS